MKIIGIDPGSHTTGYGILEKHTGGKWRVCVHGTIKAATKDPLPARLEKIYQGIVDIIHIHQPATMAVEEVFFARDVQAALKLGQARGVVLLAARHAGLSVFSYPATSVKMAVSGYGRADKEQVQAMVCRLLNIDRKNLQISMDASDALAVALCHAHSSPVQGTPLSNSP